MCRPQRDVTRGGERLAQLGPKVGMCDADEQLRSLAQRLAEQVDCAVLGDDPVDVTSRRDDACAGL